MSVFRDFWRRHEKDPRHPIAPSVLCQDGFQMSVQASRSHYCKPRETDPEGNYTHWEVGFPSVVEPDLLKYSNGVDDEDPTDTVYGWVPTEVVDAIIAKHGGLADGL